MSGNPSDLIHPALLAALRRNSWREFTSVQKRAFRAIAQDDCDLIIGGATSSGKTEAAFLPLITRSASRRTGVSVLSISPTRALINDQFSRLSGLAAILDVPVWKWHGDASVARKDALLEKRRGILCITPESLEGRFVRQPNFIRGLLSNLDAVLIDELHQFLSGPRGHHLASLLARLDWCAERHVRRIGLSATLGDVDHAKRWLSARNSQKVVYLDDVGASSRVLSCIRGYEAPLSDGVTRGRRRLQGLQAATLPAIAAVLLETHRRGTHLVFAGSKRIVESLCSDLRERTASASLPDRFRAHHGNMGRHERERLEQELRSGAQLSVLTTSTLEVGVDIGSVDAIDQIGAPRSLAALRQRVGRSGRRNDPAMVTIHVTEEPTENARSLLDALRLNTVRAIASLNLLSRRFVEPPEADGSVLSVLLQQTLSIILDRGGASLSELTLHLRSVVPFARISERSYATLLESLCEAKPGLLYEAPEGKYRLTEQAEKLFESNEIYAAFQGVASWEVWSRSEHVGLLPRRMCVELGDTFRLSGRAWRVIAVSADSDRVSVEPSRSGAVPCFGLASGEPVHEAVATEMRRVLQDTSIPDDCDDVTGEFLRQGRAAFRDAGLQCGIIVEDAGQEICHLFTWRGTAFNSVLATLLRSKDLGCEVNEVAVSISCESAGHVLDALLQATPSMDELSEQVEAIEVGKFDKWVPARLLREDWARRHEHFEQDLRDFCASLSQSSLTNWPAVTSAPPCDHPLPSTLKEATSSSVPYSRASM